MQKTSNPKDSLAHRARFMILKTDTHLAGICAEFRLETGGRRSQAVLALAEEILSGGYSVKPLNMLEILALANEGGLSITTHLTTTSKRFPLVLQALEGCEGFKARGDRLKSIIEKPFHKVLSRQLELGANSLQSKPSGQPSQAIINSPPLSSTPAETSETNFSFVSEKPKEPTEKFNAKKTLARGLMEIAQ